MTTRVMAEYRKMTTRECMDYTPEDLELMTTREVERLATKIEHLGVYLEPYEKRHRCSVICGVHIFSHELDLRGAFLRMPTGWVWKESLAEKLADWENIWSREGVENDGFAMVAFAKGISERHKPVLRVYKLRDDYFLAVVETLEQNKVTDLYKGVITTYVCDQERGLMQMLSEVVPVMVRTN